MAQGKHHNPGFLALVNDAKRRVKEITTAQYAELMSDHDPHVLIDVREDHEWNAGRAQGAVHLCKGIIERDIETMFPDKNQKLVLYCGGGYRSALAADALQKMGYTNVFSLAGGWRGWLEAGLPVEGF